MNKELFNYLKLFNNYKRRFKHLTIVVPLDIYNRFRDMFESKATSTGFIKYGEMSDVVIFRNWREL